MNEKLLTELRLACIVEGLAIITLNIFICKFYNKNIKRSVSKSSVILVTISVSLLIVCVIHSFALQVIRHAEFTGQAIYFNGIFFLWMIAIVKLMLDLIHNKNQ